jgi:EAL domain-containing protein (putative c-di-GMP-specific phosphodiesterase class I)
MKLKGKWGRSRGMENTTINLTKEIKEDLEKALKNNEFFIHYQPQIDTKTNKIYGVESLLRWYSSKHGYIPPDTFIPLAEETGIIIEIGEWVLKQVCIQLKIWERSGININTFINISAIQLQNKDFLYNVKRIIKETNVNPTLINFEITESVLIKSTKKVKRMLEELKDLGIKIALDDFGTGYSSLLYLNTFPIDIIKIDRAFIQNISNSNIKKTIVEGILYIAQNLGIDVIAEGIENKEELEFLEKRNCNKAQGYLFSEPLAIDEVEIFLNQYTQNVI